MLKTFGLIASVGFALLAVDAQALEIKEDSTWCISQKTLAKYERVKNLEDKSFVDLMLSRAACVERKKPEPVALVSQSGQYIQLETTDGQRVWVMKDRVTGLDDE